MFRSICSRSTRSIRRFPGRTRCVQPARGKSDAGALAASAGRPGSLADDPEQEWRAERGGEGADGKFATRHQIACEEVGQREETGAEEGGDWQERARFPADEGACQMG